jgi:hypothetical protein
MERDRMPVYLVLSFMEKDQKKIKNDIVLKS